MKDYITDLYSNLALRIHESQTSANIYVITLSFNPIWIIKLFFKNIDCTLIGKHIWSNRHRFQNLDRGKFRITILKAGLNYPPPPLNNTSKGLRIPLTKYIQKVYNNIIKKIQQRLFYLFYNKHNNIEILSVLYIPRPYIINTQPTT